MASSQETQAAPDVLDDLDLFGAGLQEYATAIDAQAAAMRKAHESPDDPSVREELKLADERIRLLRYERDNAGAFKVKKFDRELQEMFDSKEGEAPLIERTESGFFVAAESERNRRMMFVDMLELDRFNKEGGGHDAGDNALNQTVAAVRAAVEAGLKGREGRQASFKMYRSGGNQYMVSFDDIDESAFAAIQEAVGKAKPTIREGIEPAPLVVTGVNFRDVIEDLNIVQGELPESARLEGGDAAAKEMMQIMLRQADWGAEVRKFAKRAERMRDKLAPAEGAPDPKAAEFFANYVAKTFQGTEFATIEDIKAAIKDGSFEAKVRAGAVKAAHRRFEIDRAAGEAETASADEIAREEILKKRVEAHAEPSRRERGESSGVERLAVVPERTEGERALDAKREAMRAAKAELAAGTANPEMHEDQLRLLRLKADVAETAYRVESARRNIGTGLLERGVYYEDLEDALRSGEPTSTVFIDMGFLKYFDQKGGVETGNDALRVAASLLERAVKEAGVEGMPYRIGGDEFTVLLKGDREAAAKFEATLARLNAEAGKIGGGPKSKPEYAPTELQFNMGSADRPALERITAASPRKDMTVNQKAELMTKAADLEVEYRKATARFKYLLGQMRDPRFKEARPGLAREGEKPARTLADVVGRGAGPEDYTRQVESKIGYSAKALFAEAGGETVLRVFADELRHLSSLPEGERADLEAEIEDQLRRFVSDRVKAAHASEGGRKRVLDELLEARTTVQFFESELRDLQARAGGQKKRIRDLEGALAKAESDFQEMVQARKSLGGVSEAA